MKKPNHIAIKTGTADEFMVKVKQVMRAVDKGVAIEPSHTIFFEAPSELLHFLTETKLQLIEAIRKQPGSITHIANTISRNRAAVGRDIQELERFGLVKTHEAINPGHGRHKIVELVAQRLKLAAYL